MKELTLFEDIEATNDIRIHYQNLPEYNNVKQEDPKIVVTFKFRSQEDFEEFNELLKKHIYHTNKVFDGMQRKEVKTAWYPLSEKASNYKYL